MNGGWTSSYYSSFDVKWGFQTFDTSVAQCFREAFSGWSQWRWFSWSIGFPCRVMLVVSASSVPLNKSTYSPQFQTQLITTLFFSGRSLLKETIKRFEQERLNEKIKEVPSLVGFFDKRWRQTATGNPPKKSSFYQWLSHQRKLEDVEMMVSSF